MASQSPGRLLVVDPDAKGGSTERDTFMCCHCNKIIVVVPGSGRERGFCRMCMDMTCGGENCQRCIPFEAKLEAMEGTRRLWKQLVI